MARDFAKLYGFGCLGLIVVLFGAAILMRRTWARCPAVVQQRVPAPSARFDAVAFGFECGLGRKGTANVSIVPTGGEPAFPANLFVATDSSGTSLMGAVAPPTVELAWQGDSAITIRYSAGARILSQKPSAHRVRAVFEER